MEQNIFVLATTHQIMVKSPLSARTGNSYMKDEVGDYLSLLIKSYEKWYLFIDLECSKKIYTGSAFHEVSLLMLGPEHH